MLKCQKDGLALSLQENKGVYEIEHQGFSWVSEGRKPYVLVRRNIAGKQIPLYLPFCAAKVKTHKVENDAIVSRYTGFSLAGTRFPFTLVCTAQITDGDTVAFSLRAENEQPGEIAGAYFPAPFNSRARTQKAYAVDCMRQGLLMPDGYNKNFISTFAITKYWRKINTGDCYLPLWGRICGKNGFAAVVETPYDACMFSCFGKNRSLLNSVHWQSSLGALSYERKIRFTFFAGGDYNTVAKTYRRYLQESGQFVRIKEKIQKNPNVKALIGSPVLHHGILSNISPDSKFYKKNGENRKLFATFEKRAEQLRKMHEMGLEKLYIHTDGWGVAGYDNQHPYVLPPNADAGGYEGLKKLSQTSKELGYVFGIHDQYRDFYYDCAQFDMEKAVTNMDGSHPFCSIWDGGKHTWLCASQALDFVKQTYTQLAAHGVEIGGTYLDVFGVVQGDECFHPEHRATREESIRYRAQCFDYLREKGIIVSSEEGSALLLDRLDLVHHAPYAVRPQGGGVAVGIPVPIDNLVFHDCVFVPWTIDGTGGWGIPDGDAGKLHCILNAQTPYFTPFPQGTELCSDDELREKIHTVQTLGNLQARLYDKEMVSHKFVDGNLRRQQTCFADGTTITVDFDQNTYEIREGQNAEV